MTLLLVCNPYLQAIALIGNPKVLFLDEPTTGMDPVARKHLGNALEAARARGQSIVLTSHSMDECEALCTRLGIMIEGRMQCLGSPQHLRSRFGRSFSVVATAQISMVDRDPELGQLFHFIRTELAGAVLKEKNLNRVRFEVAAQHYTVAGIFGKMEVGCAALPLRRSPRLCQPCVPPRTKVAVAAPA